MRYARSPSSKVRDLGVVFDQYLTFHDHISGICKSTHFHLRGIGRNRNFLTFKCIISRAYFEPCLLCVPLISKTCANSFFDRYFVYAAPALWNALDLDIRLLPLHNLFMP